MEATIFITDPGRAVPFSRSRYIQAHLGAHLTQSTVSGGGWRQARESHGASLVLLAQLSG